MCSATSPDRGKKRRLFSGGQGCHAVLGVSAGGAKKKKQRGFSPPPRENGDKNQERRRKKNKKKPPPTFGAGFHPPACQNLLHWVGAGALCAKQIPPRFFKPCPTGQKKMDPAFFAFPPLELSPKRSIATPRAAVVDCMLSPEAVGPEGRKGGSQILSTGGGKKNKEKEKKTKQNGPRSPSGVDVVRANTYCQMQRNKSMFLTGRCDCI